MSNQQSQNPSVTPSPNRSPHPNPNNNEAKIEPVLAGYLLDDSHLGMVNLLNAKKSGSLLLKDPTIDLRIYSQTPWALTQNQLPTIPETGEYVFCSSRSLQEGSAKNIQRQLDGLVNDVLHFKRDNGITQVYDPESYSVVGRAHYFSLKFSGYDREGGKDITTNWHLVEYESNQGDPMMTLCKLRLEDKTVKDARGEVAKEKARVKKAVLAAEKEKSLLKVNQLPEDNEFARAVVQARALLTAAEQAVDTALDALNTANQQQYDAIVGPRQVRAAAAAAALAPPADDFSGGWLLGIGQDYTLINDAAAATVTDSGEGKADE